MWGGPWVISLGTRGRALPLHTFMSHRPVGLKGLRACNDPRRAAQADVDSSMHGGDRLAQDPGSPLTYSPQLAMMAPAEDANGLPLNGGHCGSVAGWPAQPKLLPTVIICEPPAPDPLGAVAVSRSAAPILLPSCFRHLLQCHAPCGLHLAAEITPNCRLSKAPGGVGQRGR